jgi:uncharacterized Zn finger protein
MPKKKTPLDRFADLTWNDIEEWAGSKIVSRGKNYQRQGFVSDLAVTDDGGLIAQVKPSAYREATKYLRKAAKVMHREKKTAEWERYLKELREVHARKRRLLEILDGLEGKPILKKRR